MTVRIDTLRRDIAAAIDMLNRTAAELDTLHELAYTRPSNNGTDKVKGGTPDYALDRYGDTQARRALQVIAEHVLKACRTIERGAREAQSSIVDHRNEVDNSRSRTQITVAEYIESLDAMERRRARGEYTPHQVHPQPMLRGVEATLKADNKRLRKQITRLERLIAKGVEVREDQKRKTSTK